MTDSSFYTEEELDALPKTVCYQVKFDTERNNVTIAPTYKTERAIQISASELRDMLEQLESKPRWTEF